MITGYAKVSTIDQDLSLQEAALKAWGCIIISVISVIFGCMVP